MGDRETSAGSAGPDGRATFRNSQEFLERESARAVEDRRRAGLEGLVGDLACVIVNVEPDRQRQAVEELHRYTGLEFTGAFEGPGYVTAVLSLGGSADVLVRSRRRPQENPFRAMNDRPKSRRLPNTRLETLVFHARDLPRYVEIQKARGVRFVTDDIVRTDTYSFIQTVPSTRIGASYGFIEWRGRRTYSFDGRRDVRWDIPAPAAPYRARIGRLDHVAARLAAEDRDQAILEFLRLTNHRYSFSIYVESLNSITNVTRRSDRDVGLVFTTGIAPYAGEGTSGPTETFVHHYGARAHHLAFHTEDIERVFEGLRADGASFLTDLVGGPSEGLHQAFTTPSPHTLLVTEYIHRYNGFQGYFTLSNVTALTEATANQ